ncbi:uncharacterized protein EV420DRAFT_1257401, partial [Desarmillaria tabescens]
YRPLGFRTDISDYAYYVWKRAILLANPSVARAALMHGGLIWRIAMDHVESSSFVLSGPGEGVFEEGSTHVLQDRSRRNSSPIWAEELREDQIDIICGTYKVYNHSSKCISMTQDVSWFPKEGSFKNSGLDLGFWSADAEHWYLRRVKWYRDGHPKGRCQNQTEWRRSIRLWHAATKMSQGLEALSKCFVEKHVLNHEVP